MWHVDQRSLIILSIERDDIKIKFKSIGYKYAEVVISEVTSTFSENTIKTEQDQSAIDRLQEMIGEMKLSNISNVKGIRK